MGTPTYVVKKIGDNYLPVLNENPCAGRSAAFLAGGLLLALVGRRRGGLLGNLAAVTGLGCMVRGVSGINPLLILCPGCAQGARNGQPSEAPSYQNDFSGRAPQMPSDLVDEQSMESFPASDPPGRTGTVLA